MHIFIFVVSSTSVIGLHDLLVDGVKPGAGKIGRQIAEEVIEMQRWVHIRIFVHIQDLKR